MFVSIFVPADSHDELGTVHRNLVGGNSGFSGSSGSRSTPSHNVTLI